MSAEPAPEPDNQDGLFDQVLDNPLLEKALEKRYTAKVAAAKATKAAKEAHDGAKGMIGTLELPEETVVRCGRFRITRKVTKARHVEFDAEAGSQTRISFLGDA